MEAGKSKKIRLYICRKPGPHNIVASCRRVTVLAVGQSRECLAKLILLHVLEDARNTGQRRSTRVPGDLDMRSIWKGHIRFLLVAIPVRIYNAIETSEKIQFNQLHRDDYGPIGYDKRCKKCGQVVTNDQITKGYQYETDRYAIVEPEDIAKVKIKTTKAVDIIGFVDANEIPSYLLRLSILRRTRRPGRRKTICVAARGDETDRQDWHWQSGAARPRRSCGPLPSREGSGTAKAALPA